MKRPAKNIEADFLGDLEPLSPRRNPAETDRRGISLRWFGGSVLTGLASVFLMGGALYAALDGRQNLAVPAQAYQRLSTEPAPDSARTEKSDRPVKTTASFDPANDDGKVFMVPTVSREGEQDAMILRCEAAGTPESLAAGLSAALQEVTKLRGRVELVTPGSLPNDGKVIDDQRRYDR